MDHSSHTFPGQPTPFDLHRRPPAGPARTPLILVVDDEPHIVEFLSLLLEEEGYRVRRAANGGEALAAINEERPDLIISDVMMPLVNGVELLRHVARADWTAQPKVILMSAVTQGVPAANVPFIEKPFDIDDLLGMIDLMLAEEEQTA